MNQLTENNVVTILVCILIGIIIGVLYMSTERDTIIEKIKKEESEKREIVIKKMDSILKLENNLKTILDSTVRSNDSILLLRERVYSEKIRRLLKNKDEEINRINTVDSAYLDILSR